MPSPSPTLLSVRDLCSLLGLSRPYVTKLLKSHTIPNLRAGGRFIISKSAIEKWLENLGAPQTPSLALQAIPSLVPPEKTKGNCKLAQFPVN
jgi:excisionase family DNA binding protein